MVSKETDDNIMNQGHSYLCKWLYSKNTDCKTLHFAFWDFQNLHCVIKLIRIQLEGAYNLQKQNKYPYKWFYKHLSDIFNWYLTRKSDFPVGVLVAMGELASADWQLNIKYWSQDINL